MNFITDIGKVIVKGDVIILSTIEPFVVVHMEREDFDALGRPLEGDTLEIEINRTT